MHRPTLSLIVCTYHRPEPISRLLRTVFEQTRVPDEILIIDGSIDERTEKLFESAEQFKGVAYHRVDASQRGLTRQRNIGVAMSTGDIIAFLDDDIELEQGYFEELLRTYQLHPDAIAVSGYIVNENEWIPAGIYEQSTRDWYVYDGWKSRESSRVRFRSLLGMGYRLPSGYVPEEGHGRAAGLYPPTGRSYRVETLMGGVASYRRDLFRHIQFSLYFYGYGLYEDMDFTVRASRFGSLYITTAARCTHHHDRDGRPNQLHFGTMVVRNGWYVWRIRWPRPSRIARLRWWSITTLLVIIRLWNAVTGPQRMQAFSDAVGRIIGAWTVFFNPPRTQE